MSKLERGRRDADAALWIRKKREVETRNGRFRSRWVPESCGACTVEGAVERIKPLTVVGGIRDVNRGRIEWIGSTEDGSAAFVTLEQLPDRAGDTFDGEPVPGSDNFVVPMRERFQLAPCDLGRAIRSPTCEEASDPAYDACLSRMMITVPDLRPNRATVDVRTEGASSAQYTSRSFQFGRDHRSKTWTMEEGNDLAAVRLGELSDWIEANDRHSSSIGFETWELYASFGALGEDERACVLNVVAASEAEEKLPIGVFETIRGLVTVSLLDDGRWELWNCSKHKRDSVYGDVVGAGQVARAWGDIGAAVSADGKLLAVHPVGPATQLVVFDLAGGTAVPMSDPAGNPRSFEDVMGGYAGRLVNDSEMVFSPNADRLVYYGRGVSGSPMLGYEEFFVWDSRSGTLLLERPKWKLVNTEDDTNTVQGPPDRNCNSDEASVYGQCFMHDGAEVDGRKALLEKPVPSGMSWLGNTVVLMERDGPTRILSDVAGREIALMPTLAPDYPFSPLKAGATSLSPDGSRAQIGSYIIDPLTWGILLDMHQEGNALWLSHDWTTAAIVNDAGAIEFISLNFEDPSIPDEALSWRDWMLRNEFQHGSSS